MRNFLIVWLPRAAAAFFAVAIFLLTWRVGWPWAALKFSEFFFALALGSLGLTLMISAPARARLWRILLVLRVEGRWLGLLLLAAVIGHAASIFLSLDWQAYAGEIWLEYSRLLLSVLLFFAVIYLCVAFRNLNAYLLGIAAFSPLTLWASLFPAWHRVFFLAVDERLRGPGSDPNYLGSWLGLGVITAFAVFLWARGGRRWLGLSGMVGLFPLLLWTSSRGAILAVGLGFAATGLKYVLGGFTLRRAGSVATALTALLVGFWLSFAAAPPPVRAAITDRLVVPFVGRQSAIVMFLNPGLRAASGSLSGVEAPVFELGADRRKLFFGGGRLLLGHPFGFGPAYYRWQPVAYAGDGAKLGPHNLFLEAGLTGGYLGLIALLGFLWSIARRLAGFSSGENWVGGALIGCFVALLAVSFSLDTLTLRWLWLIMGLVVARSLDSDLTIASSEGLRDNGDES